MKNISQLAVINSSACGYLRVPLAKAEQDVEKYENEGKHGGKICASNKRRETGNQAWESCCEDNYKSSEHSNSFWKFENCLNRMQL